MKKLRTIDDIKGKLEKSDRNFSFQKQLTVKLDKELPKKQFDQQVINEIVLWKVNRYVLLDDEVLSLLNTVNRSQTMIDKEFTTQLLKKLLKIQGINLPMASTFLRFSNPLIYQIIDQRVYRFIMRYPLKLKLNTSNKGIELNIDAYLKYLQSLRKKCNQYQIKFSESDRLLFNMDKRINKDFKINY